MVVAAAAPGGRRGHYDPPPTHHYGTRTPHCICHELHIIICRVCCNINYNKGSIYNTIVSEGFFNMNKKVINTIQQQWHHRHHHYHQQRPTQASHGGGRCALPRWGQDDFPFSVFFTTWGGGRLTPAANTIANCHLRWKYYYNNHHSCWYLLAAMVQIWKTATLALENNQIVRNIFSSLNL